MSDSTESLFRLIYASRMSRGTGPKDIEGILEASRRNNPSLGVTGALCYSVRGFVQCLEGDRKAVNDIFRRIVRDSRNEEVTLISYGPAPDRRFAEWTMAYVRADEVDQALLARHGAGREFDPYGLSADQALGLLEDTARERAAFLALQKDKLTVREE